MSTHCPGCDCFRAIKDIPCPGCGHEEEIARLTAYIRGEDNTLIDEMNARIARLTAERESIKARALTTINGYKADNIAMRDALSVVTAERDALRAFAFGVLVACVEAGGQSGDTTVQLANVRALVKERDALRDEQVRLRFELHAKQEVVDALRAEVEKLRRVIAESYEEAP